MPPKWMVAILAVLAVLVGALVWYWDPVAHFLYVISGTRATKGSDPWYNFNSGAASELVYLGALGTVIAWWRKQMCHTPWCVRWGRHPAAGGLYHLCTKHHPDTPQHRRHLTLDLIHLHHNQHTRGEPLWSPATSSPTSWPSESESASAG